ncbi:hypothetical protein VI817_001803 [Penicillium citrinum]|nr:hypothetical protein VI817_001803 [Penicillium citrinum]
MSWQAIGQRAQNAVLESIPARWKLNPRQYSDLTDVTHIPYECGLMTKDQLAITELTVIELLDLLKLREVKASEVLEAFAARAAIAHQLTNCLTEWFFEDGLQRANELDEAFANSGKLQGPLHGIPIALKDAHEIAGHAVTMGYVARKDNIARRDSNLIETLRNAGAIFFCKTTMPQSGMALETVSNLWGRTTNPYNRNLGAGGSSGGDSVLVAMRGSPIAPSTDMGGSIRVPAAFNGLYGIRPTSDRIPKGGMQSTNGGNLTIKLSCGPVCHSLQDLELFTRVINSHPNHQYDVTSVPVPWRELGALGRKLAIGIMKWDGVVMPHPPVLRALEHTKKVLKRDGHEGSSTTEATLKASGEPIIPAFAELLRIFDPQAKSAAEALQLNIHTRFLKEKFAEAWDRTADKTTTGRTIDALILPPAPGVGYPHDFNLYWGYTSLFNLVDYPSVILPILNFKVDPERDVLDEQYSPLDTNPFDKLNYELYNPEMFMNQPSTIQIVGRPFEDEEIIRVASILDDLFQTP